MGWFDDIINSISGANGVPAPTAAPPGPDYSEYLPGTVPEGPRFASLPDLRGTNRNAEEPDTVNAVKQAVKTPQTVIQKQDKGATPPPDLTPQIPGTEKTAPRVTDMAPATGAGGTMEENLAYMRRLGVPSPENPPPSAPVAVPATGFGAVPRASLSPYDYAAQENTMRQSNQEYNQGTAKEMVMSHIADLMNIVSNPGMHSSGTVAEAQNTLKHALPYFGAIAGAHTGRSGLDLMAQETAREQTASNAETEMAKAGITAATKGRELDIEAPYKAALTKEAMAKAGQEPESYAERLQHDLEVARAGHPGPDIYGHAAQSAMEVVKDAETGKETRSINIQKYNQILRDTMRAHNMPVPKSIEDAAAQQPEPTVNQILVKNKKTGIVGHINDNEYDPTRYEKVK